MVERISRSVAVHDARMRVASLRYFRADGAFAGSIRAALGVPLPEAGRLIFMRDADLLLAWRRPGEAWLLAAEPAPIRRLESAVAALHDGCVVDLSGGACVLRVQGEACDELMTCLGGPNVVPAEGESRSGRLAELPVTALRLRPDEILLVVERVYAPHLMEWIRASAPDL